MTVTLETCENTTPSAVIDRISLVLDAFELIFLVVPLVMPPLLAQVPDAAWVSALARVICGVAGPILATKASRSRSGLVACGWNSG